METKYLIHERQIDRNCRDIKNAFRNVKFVPSYSVKTNHVPAIVKRFHDNGFLTEVVSDMEVEIAKSQGIDMSCIVYNGPIKGPEAYEVASGGGVLCFDSMDDLLFRKYPKGTRCMFRVSINIDNGVNTRFGTEPAMIPEEIKKAAELGYDPIGIHCHVTRGRDIRSWRQRIAGMLPVYKEVCGMLSEKIVDFGGNMYSPMPEYQIMKLYDDYASYDDYAALFEKYAPDFEGATLSLEMGTSAAANCMDFRTSVIGVKHCGAETFVLLDACRYNLGWASDRYNFPITILSSGADSETVENATFVGRLCTENDVLYRGYEGKIGKGDVVSFENVGAYTISVKPPFIIPQFPILYVRSDGEIHECKRQERAQDILTTYMY